ncbi:protein of unknown function [Paraburkholderia kururiensis]
MASHDLRRVSADLERRPVAPSPTFVNPTGATLSKQRRSHLLELAVRRCAQNCGHRSAPRSTFTNLRATCSSGQDCAMGSTPRTC